MTVSAIPPLSTIAALGVLTLANHAPPSSVEPTQQRDSLLSPLTIGPPEKAHLFRLNILLTTVALGEGPPIKHWYAELGKLSGNMASSVQFDIFI